MNVLVSSASYLFSDSIPGGEFQVSHAIVSGLAARGHRVHVIAPEARLRRPIPNVTIHCVGGHFLRRDRYFRYRWNWWVFNAKAFLAARRILARFPIDVVHHIRPAFPEKFSLCCLLPRPFIYGPASLPNSASVQGDINQFSTQEGWIDNLKNRLVDRLDMTAGQSLWRLMLKRAIAIPVSLAETRTYLHDVPASRSPLIPLGVDTEVFTPAKRLAAKPRALYAGYLSGRKGLNHLLRAVPIIADSVPDFELVIAGDGPERPNLERLVAELAVERHVRFLGGLPFRRMPAVYKDARLFVLPALAEAFGLAPLQAMASGLPIVASRVGGLPTFVDDGASGYLVEPGNSAQIAEAVIDILTHSESAIRMGAHNRDRIVRQFSWQSVVEKIETIYGRCTLDGQNQDPVSL